MKRRKQLIPCLIRCHLRRKPRTAASGCAAREDVVNVVESSPPTEQIAASSAEDMDCQNAVELEVMEDDDSTNQQVITESPVVGESESRILSGSVQVEETPPAALAAAAVTGLETNDIGDLASTASTLAPDVKLRLVHHRTPGPRRRSAHTFTCSSITKVIVKVNLFH